MRNMKKIMIIAVILMLPTLLFAVINQKSVPQNINGYFVGKIFALFLQTFAHFVTTETADVYLFAYRGGRFYNELRDSL